MQNATKFLHSKIVACSNEPSALSWLCSCSQWIGWWNHGMSQVHSWAGSPSVTHRTHVKCHPRSASGAMTFDLITSPRTPSTHRASRLHTLDRHSAIWRTLELITFRLVDQRTNSTTASTSTQHGQTFLCSYTVVLISRVVAGVEGWQLSVLLPLLLVGSSETLPWPWSAKEFFTMDLPSRGVNLKN